MPPVSLLNIALIAGGGAAGSVLRYLLGTWVMARATHGWPWGTLLVNVLGSLLIGAVLAWHTRQQMPAQGYLLLATGFCGGFTTFSALSIESWQLLRQQQYSALAVYLAASLILGIGAAALGYQLSK
ncbi:MAG: fluoride efflux transporter CrcB [Chitinophagaceae bacterium]|jgi:CrcB protein|nr:fluoride efflux transporter CrcB [Chitinophagaceae bacterium]